MGVMTFIDSQMAEKINGLNRETLEYALGDILSEKQMDLMVERVEKFQKHMKDNMVKVEPDGWELNKYTKDTPVTNDRERKEKENYLKGVESLNKSLTLMAPTGDNFFQRDHKDAFIGAEIINFKKEREKGPKTAISFEEIQKQEKQAGRKEPKMVLGKKSEEAVARAERIREQRRKELEAQKAKQTKTPAKQTSSPERKSLGAGIRK